MGRPRTRTTAAAASDKATALRVATYNVLSSHLGGPDHFRRCDPAALAASARLPKVLAKLARECDKEAVICLQEVSTSWAGPLYAFFAARGYAFVPSFYGQPSNGYMGCGLAYKTAKYTLDAVNISRLSDSRSWPRPPRPTGLRARLASAVAGSVLGRMWRAALNRKPSEDAFAFSRNRYNTIVYAALTDKQSGGSFGVSTYHMPCAFWNPPAMTIHAALAAQKTAALARKPDGSSLPYILAGDFNITPRSPQYALLTTGELPGDAAGADATPAYPPGDGWRAEVQPLRSALAEAHGAEPAFTNYVCVKEEPEFVETLDYVFVSPDVEVAGADALPVSTEGLGGPLPSAEEPSDHLLLAADLRC